MVLGVQSRHEQIYIEGDHVFLGVTKKLADIACHSANLTALLYQVNVDDATVAAEQVDLTLLVYPFLHELLG